jgi:hypothetical protein
MGKTNKAWHAPNRMPLQELQMPSNSERNRFAYARAGRSNAKFQAKSVALTKALLPFGLDLFLGSGALRADSPGPSHRPDFSALSSSAKEPIATVGFET